MEEEPLAWGPGSIWSTLLLTPEGLSLSHLQTGSVGPHLEGCCKDSQR